jgi:hypothetical protein
MELRMVGGDDFDGRPAVSRVRGGDFRQAAQGDQQLASLLEHVYLPLRAERREFHSVRARASAASYELNFDLRLALKQPIERRGGSSSSTDPKRAPR